MTNYTIDAKNKKLGRLATEIATILQGKNSPSYEREVLTNVTVTIDNANQVRIDGEKINEEYSRYTGYPGGLITEKRGSLLKRKGMGEIIKKTVKNMLPKNKQQKILLQRIIVNE